LQAYTRSNLRTVYILQYEAKYSVALQSFDEKAAAIERSNEGNDKMGNLTYILMLLMLLALISGCVDKTYSIGLCEDKNLSFYSATWNCNTICLNKNTGEKHIYATHCSFQPGG
jgi:hypothetical protein